MFKYIILLVILLASLDAKININDINKKPSCRAKDFMIWQFLNQDKITPSDAKKAYSQIQTINNKLLFSYAKKTNDENIKKEVLCKKETNLLKIKDKKCLQLALDPSKILSLNTKQKMKLKRDIDSKLYKGLIVISNAKNIQEVYKRYKADTFLTYFNNVSKEYRVKNLNIFLSKKYLNTISSNNNFLKFLQIIIDNKKLNKLQLSLLKIDAKNLKTQTYFLLALNYIKHSKSNKALEFLQLSLSKATKTADKDKIYFWMYKVSKDKKYLQELTKSNNINIYTIFASEVLDKQMLNYFSAVESSGINHNLNISNPFDVNKILKDIKQTPNSELFAFANKYSQDNMTPIQSLILQKAYRYKMHGYLMPYNDYLKDISLDEKAFVYALMRQESGLIPSAISTSYALGLMQIMPFVVDIISERVKNPIKTYDEMFLAKNNIKYALEHIKWMRNHLKHPLFLAYAYNGGMGFFKRYLQEGKFTKAKYEPYLSIELMQNNQAREYGKKVLANYVIYKKIMKDDISIIRLFDKLTQQKSKVDSLK